MCIRDSLSPELLEEGFVREIISKIQTMRKEADFEVMDRIKVTYEGSEKACLLYTSCEKKEETPQIRKQKFAKER